MSYIVPTEGITISYFSDPSIPKRHFRSRDGEQIKLKLFPTSREMLSVERRLIFENGSKVVVYASYKKHIYFGKHKKSNVLIIINFKRNEVQLTSFTSGWLYFDILINHYINNKCNK